MSDMSKLPKDVQLVIQKLIDVEQLKCVVLYGSFARGTYTGDSDIDLAACYNHKMTSDEYFKLTMSLSDVTDRKIDFVDLYSVYPPHSQEIFKYGEWIKKDSILFAQILSRTLAEEKDFLPIKTKIQKIQLKRFLK